MAEKILIVDDDIDTLRLVGLMLQRQGYQIIAATNGQQGLSKAIEEKPDLILLDVMMPDMDGYEVTRQLRQNMQTANIPILMFTAKTQLDDKVTGFEAGADDYLTKPTHPSELQAHVKALLVRSAQRGLQPVTAPLHQPGFLIGVIGARGGLGASTLAMNIAAGLFSRTQSEVILAELVPGKGTLGLDLGVPSQKGLTKLLSGSPNDVTRDRVEEGLVPHISGIKVLLASDRPSDFHLINQVAQYEVLMVRLASMARFVVLDLGSALPNFTQKILPSCHECIVVLEGVANTITQTRTLISEIADLGVDKRRIKPVLNNRVRSDAQMAWTTAQEKLGEPISATLTPAPELFTQGTRMQTAAILCQPDGTTAQQIFKLVDQIIQDEAAGP